MERWMDGGTARREPAGKDDTGSNTGAGAPARRAALICAGRRRPHRTAPAAAAHPPTPPAPARSGPS